MYISLSLTLSLSDSLSLTLWFSDCHTLILSLSHSDSLSLTFWFSLSHTLILSLSLSDSLTVTLWFSDCHTLILSLPHYHTKANIKQILKVIFCLFWLTIYSHFRFRYDKSVDDIMTLTELLEYKNQTRNSTHEAFDRLDGQSNKKVGRTKKTEKLGKDTVGRVDDIFSVSRRQVAEEEIGRASCRERVSRSV